MRNEASLNSHLPALKMRSPLGKLFLLYLVSHIGLFFLHNGVFWDDWTLFNNNADALLATFRESGAFFNITGHLHVLLLKAGPWIYKALTFVFMFMAGVFLFRILLRQTWLNERSSFLIAAFFLVLPLNAGRVTMICFPYTFSYLLFFWAWYLAPRYRLFSLILFFFSFNTQSFLVFYMLPLLETFIKYFPGRFDVRQTIKFITRHLDFLLLPILFWIVKTIFFKPTGLFAGYNEQFSLSNFIRAPKPMILDLLAIRPSVPWVCLFIAIAGFFFVYYSIPANNKRLGNDEQATIPSPPLFWAGCVALFAGLFPYLILGYSPTFHEWSSRHQLLMPMGVAFLIVWLVNWLPGYAGRIVIIVVLAGSVSANFAEYRDFYNDIRKQDAIVAFLRTDPTVNDADVIILEDSTPKAISRTYRFYELTGMMAIASGQQRHFMLPTHLDLEKYRAGNYDKMFTSTYHAAEHVRKADPKVLNLAIGFASQHELLPNGYKVVIAE